jgi:hypothetical protein
VGVVKQEQETTPEVGIERSRSPLGRTLPERPLNVLWVAVLTVAVVVPGMNIQVTIDVAGIAWFRYLNATAVVAVLAGVVLGTTYLMSGRRWGVALRLTASIVFVFFLWPLFSKLDVVGGVAGAVLVVLPPLLLIVAAAMYGDRLLVAVPIAVLALVVLLGIGYQVLGRGVGEPHYDQFASVSALAGAEYPDVLLVMVDGYARDDVLRDMYDYDNDGFLDELSGQGFVVNPETSANYSRTYASLGSVMSLGYPVPVGPISEDTNADLRILREQSGSLVHSFTERGYDITVAETAWFGAHCGPLVDHCWREGTTRSSAYYLSLLTPVASLVQNFVAHPFHATSWTQLRKLSSSFTSAADRPNPQFMFVHLTVPHPPVNLDASCTQRYESWRHGLPLTAVSEKQASERRRTAFVEQTECVNFTLVQEFEKLLATSPNTAVMLFSDHGPDGHGQLWTLPDELSPQASHERLAVLSAARTPDRCERFDSSLTLVNAVRGFTGCVLGLDIPPLPDRAFWVPAQNTDTDVVEVELARRTP